MGGTGDRLQVWVGAVGAVLLREGAMACRQQVWWVQWASGGHGRGEQACMHKDNLQ